MTEQINTEAQIKSLLEMITPDLYAAMGDQNITPATLIELVVRTLVAVQVIQIETVRTLQ